MIEPLWRIRRWNKLNKSAGARMIIGGAGLGQPSASKVRERRTKGRSDQKAPSAQGVPSVISIPCHVDEAASMTTMNDGDCHGALPPAQQEEVRALPECRRSSYVSRSDRNHQSNAMHDQTASPRASDACAGQESLSYGFLDDNNDEQHYTRPQSSASHNPSSSSSSSVTSSSEPPLIHKDCLLASVRSMASSDAVHEELQRILALPVGLEKPGHKIPPPSHPLPPTELAKPSDMSSKDLFLATPLYPALPRPLGSSDCPPPNDGWKGARAG